MRIFKKIINALKSVGKTGKCFENNEGKLFWFRTKENRLPKDEKGTEYEWTIEFYNSFSNNQQAQQWMKINNHITKLSKHIQECDCDNDNVYELKVQKAQKNLKAIKKSPKNVLGKAGKPIAKKQIGQKERMVSNE